MNSFSLKFKNKKKEIFKNTIISYVKIALVGRGCMVEEKKSCTENVYRKRLTDLYTIQPTLCSQSSYTILKGA